MHGSANRRKRCIEIEGEQRPVTEKHDCEREKDEPAA